MQWAALVAWTITALGGLVLLAQWARHGGFAQTEGIRAPRLFAHLTVAVVGLGVWLAYVATDRRALAWVAVGLLASVAVVGVSMLIVSTRGRTTTTRTATPAEAMFPLPIVVAHGALGVTTLVLATLSAAGIGS